MKIYLVRHGADEEGYRGGWSQRGLVKEGIVESQKLGEYLQANPNEYSINTIISSDLPRAVQTTQELELKLGLSSIANKEWREMNNGVLAGMPHAQAEVQYAGVYFNTLHMDSEFPGGESPRHFYDRINQSFRELCRRIEDQELASNVLLVTHGGVINMLYYVLSGQEWTNQSSFYPIDHTSIHTVTKTNEGWKMSEMNIRNHLNET